MWYKSQAPPWPLISLRNKDNMKASMIGFLYISMCAVFTVRILTQNLTHWLPNQHCHFQAAKLPQYNGKEVFQKAFEACQTSRDDMHLLQIFEMPSSEEQAGCVTNYFWKYFDLVHSDQTTNVEKVKQQFVDYENPVPEDTDTLANINVETEKNKLGMNTMSWLKNNRNSVRFVYFGDAMTSFEWMNKESLPKLVDDILNTKSDKECG